MLRDIDDPFRNCSFWTLRRNLITTASQRNTRVVTRPLDSCILLPISSRHRSLFELFTKNQLNGRSVSETSPRWQVRQTNVPSLWLSNLVCGQFDFTASSTSVLFQLSRETPRASRLRDVSKKKSSSTEVHKRVYGTNERLILAKIMRERAPPGVSSLLDTFQLPGREFVTRLIRQQSPLGVPHRRIRRDAYAPDYKRLKFVLLYRDVRFFLAAALLSPAVMRERERRLNYFSSPLLGSFLAVW